MLDGPGIEIWRLDAATKVEAALAAADGPATTDRLGDQAATEGAAVWYARSDPVRALASFEPLVAAVGGEAAAPARRDRPWIDIMVGVAVLARAVGDHDRVARVLRRLDRAIDADGDDDELRAVWWQCRAMAALATGALGLAADAAAEASKRAAVGTLTEAACRRASALVALAGGDTASAADALAAATQQFDALGLTLAAAGCEQRRAAAEALAGDHERAWASALDALRRFDAARYRVITPYGREAWLAEYAETMAIALEMADRLSLTDAQVELVERARTQVALRTERGEAPSWSSALALESVRPIHVGAAAPVLTDGASSTPMIDLDLIRRRVGGADSWWWGTWRWRDTIHWSLIDPDGTTSAGSIALRGRLAFELADLDGPPGRERALARVLGDAVLPPPLRAALNDAASHERRLRIVVAPSAAIGGLPLATLAIGVDESSEPRRVIEAADLVVAPSAGFIDGLPRRAPVSSSPRLGVVVVADPRGDLAIARRVGIAIARERGGRALVGVDATPTALLHALARVHDTPHQTVTMVVLAHAVKTSIDDAVIELAGDGAAGRLGALELLHSEAWHLGDRFPARVLLATCASAGTTSIGESGEWLGIAPALLRCGAELVIATSWPQPEHPATAEIDRAVADVLCDADDPIGALSDLQRAWLARWRSTGWETSAEQDAGRVAPDHASPLLWAGLLAVSGGSTPAIVPT